MSLKNFLLLIQNLYFKQLRPARVFVVLFSVALLHLLPFGQKPQFIPYKGQFIEVSQDPPILEALYPQRIIAACNGGPGFNCNTGCCRDGLCVVCPQDDPTPVPIYPPTISANLSCSSGFANGWCAGSLALNLNAADPQGQAVIISGSINGTDFACAAAATNCSIPISDEGTGPITYRVDSATGLFAESSTSYKLDVTTPQINGSLSGSAGANGWYVSDVTLTASTSDSVSGLASFVSTSDGGAWTSYTTPLTFSDGVHSVVLSGTDNAGNSAQTARDFNIDTITPNVNITVTGTIGKNGWYSSGVQVTASASDSGSGVAQIEASTDGGAWSIVTGPLSLGDGHHTWQFKVTDHAGNLTQTPEQEVYVDATHPDIQLLQQTSLGETLLYEVQDEGSELVLLEFAIKDEDQTFSKLKWSQDVSGNYYEDGVLWDGKFAGGIEAPAGTYYLTIYARDAAGNESHKTGLITIDFFSFLQNIPPFDPPKSPLPAGTSFGDDIEQVEDQAGTSPSTSQVTSFGGGAGAGGGIQTVQTFALDAVSTPLASIPTSNILLGAAAAAAVGAFVAEAQRKREEEAARQAAAEAARAAANRAAFLARIEEDGRKNDNRILSYKDRAKAYQASLDNFRANLINNGFSEQEASRMKSNAVLGGSIPSVASVVADRDQSNAIEQKIAREDAAEEARWLAAQQAQEAKRAAELQAGLAAYYDAMKQGEKEAAEQLKNETNWWTSWGKSAALNLGDFVTGVAYQAIFRNNLDSLMVIAPAPKSVKDEWFQGWDNFQIDSNAFMVGRIVGGILGMVQGAWEIASGLATATGGTLVSCGTGILCIGGGAASIAAGTALITHGILVTTTSAVETFQVTHTLLSSVKKDSEMQSYEDARREGKIGEAEHIDDGGTSNPDFREKATGQYVEFKKPAPSFLNPLARQARSIANNIRKYGENIRFIIDLKNLTPQEKLAFIKAIEDAGTDMSRVKFINQ